VLYKLDVDEDTQRAKYYPNKNIKSSAFSKSDDISKSKGAPLLSYPLALNYDRAKFPGLPPKVRLDSPRSDKRLRLGSLLNLQKPVIFGDWLANLTRDPGDFFHPPIDYTEFEKSVPAAPEKVNTLVSTATEN